MIWKSRELEFTVEWIIWTKKFVVFVELTMCCESGVCWLGVPKLDSVQKGEILNCISM